MWAKEKSRSSPFNKLCHVCLLIPARSSDLYKYLKRHNCSKKNWTAHPMLNFYNNTFLWLEYILKKWSQMAETCYAVLVSPMQKSVCAPHANTTIPAHLPGSTRGPACPRRPSIPASQAARRHTPCTPSPCISQTSRSAATRPGRWGSTDTDPPLRRTHIHITVTFLLFFNVSRAVQSDLCH